MVTSWTLAGATTAYAGTLTTTDGYSITASMTWKVLTTDTTETTKCAAVICVIGTCVQTMDSAGVVVAATVVDDGNLALCHWFLLLATSPTTASNISGATNEYSVAKYLTAAQWGTAGAAIAGATLLPTGTSIGSTHGIVLSPATKPTTYAAQAYTQFWYQPTYASTYASTVLRRYNGGASDGDKVKAYCAGLRGLTTTTATDARDLVAASVAGTAGVVTLTGAQALAAGAIAFGAAALAF